MQAQGVIAYAESLAALSERELGPGALVAFESQALARSVSASIKGAELARLESERKRAHVRALVIWASRVADQHFGDLRATTPRH